MKTLVKTLIISILFIACNSKDATDSIDSEYESKDSFASLSSRGGESAGGSGGSGNGNSEAGIVTAGEWNDLVEWDFWTNLLENAIQNDSDDKQAYWNIHTNNRVSVFVNSNGTPSKNTKVELFKNTNLIWSGVTDNFGKAELWISPFQKQSTVDFSEYHLKTDDQIWNGMVKPFSLGVNEINLNSSTNTSNKVELAFIVDATGSMSDEIDFLKDDLLDVLNKIKNNNSNNNIYTSAVFYRDETDDYLTKKLDFTDNFNTTISFIQEQNADGGGDYPEAVHTALDESINNLTWSEDSKTRIAFLLLDAPPHYNQTVIENIQQLLKTSAKKGIKIIPITASGIDKNTEFLMRFSAILTNGTYSFITNHSGVGNDHIEASVGEYQVEKLNDLLVRLVNKYSE